MKFLQPIFTMIQYLLPHHALSRLMGVLTYSKNKIWKNLFIRGVIRIYGVNMKEAAESDANAYACFNDFFTRALKSDVRPISQEKNAVVSPADGAISQIGDISEGRIIQAKGMDYSVLELLGGDRERASLFENGKFATIYLSPKDYHRLHMPFSGTLKEMIHVPGRLFSVNTATAASVPRLFARNERVAAIFETEAGPMALILVGAIFVASIATVWHGLVTPPTSQSVKTWQYSDDAPRLEIGEEMGRFLMGSTIIVLFGKGRVDWMENLSALQSVRLGELLGTAAL